MRASGADVTDIVVLVIAGDEGMRSTDDRSYQQAKAADVTIVVALNKCDKPTSTQKMFTDNSPNKNFLPEAWGGQTITVNCSAVTGEGINQLLEMLALQAEVLELRANPTARARGTVLESEMHKGMGSIATVLVQNGTLHIGDAIVFGTIGDASRRCMTNLRPRATSSRPLNSCRNHRTFRPARSWSRIHRC